MKHSSLLRLSGLGIILFYLAPAGYAQSIKPGTEIKVHLIDKLDTGDAKNGQIFLATLAEPVSLGQAKVLARGVRVRGQITDAVSSAQLKRPASITLVLTRIDGTSLKTEPFQITGKSHAGSGTGNTYMTSKQEIVLPPEAELTFVVARGANVVATTPEPVAERNIEHAPQPTPARWRDDSREGLDDAFDALIFSDRDKWLIRSYFKSNYGNLPLELEKRGADLPPAIAKRLRSDETLPLSLQKRVEPFPSELEDQLPRLPPGFSRAVFSGRAMVLDQNGVIVDLILIYR